MSESVEVKITATTDDLNSALTSAQQTVSQFSNQVSAAGAQMRTTSASMQATSSAAASLAVQMRSLAQRTMDLQQAQAAAVAPVSNLGEQMRRQAQAAMDMADKTDHAGHSTGGITRELIVLGHEAMMGNFSRIGGSMMVLGERSGALIGILSSITPEVIGIGAAVIGVTALFAEWAIQAAHVETAVKAATAAAVEAGRSGPGARQQIQQGGQEIAAGGTLSVNQAEILAAQISQINWLTDEQREKVMSLAGAFAAMFGNNIKETQEFISKTFENEASLKTYLDKTNMLGADGVRAWDVTTDATKRADVGIASLTERLGAAFEQYKKLNDQATIARANAAMAGTEGLATVGGGTGGDNYATRGNIPQSSSALIDNTAATMGLTQGLANFATRIAQVESGGRQLNAQGGILTSSAGALGMMQVKPDEGGGTTRTVGGQSYDLTDPIQNVKAGLAILADLFRQFGGDQYKVAVAYNAGPRVATGQVRQSAANQAETAHYTRELGLSADSSVPSPFRPNFGGMDPGTTADMAGERAQRITDENDYAVKLQQIDEKIENQQKQLAADQAAVAAASQQAAGTERDAAVSAANARVAAVQRSIAALNEERQQLRSPMDRPAERQAQDQIAAARLAVAQTTNDPKEAAVENAEAEVNAYKLAAAQVGISDAQKEAFDRQYTQASVALINARKATEGTWMEQQRANLDAITEKAATAGGDRQQIELRTTEATKQYWASVLQGDTLTTDQRRQAQAALSSATIRFAEQSAAAEKEASDKSLRATEARLNAEVAAARGNVAQIISLEQQKVDAVRAVHGSDSAQYFTALDQQTNAVRTAVEEQVRTEEQAGQRRIANETQTLKMQLELNRITKAQEAELLAAYVTQERDRELGSLNSLIATLAQGTSAYKAAIDERTKLAEKFDTEIKKLQASQVQDAAAANLRYTESVISDFSRIQSAGEQAFTGVITGQQTVQQAELKVAQAILESFIQLGVQLVERWVVTQLAMTSSAATQDAVRASQSLAISNTGFGALIAAWMGTEAAKTGMTTASAATRAGVETSGGLLSAIGTILARWLGLETAKTVASTTGAGARTAAETTAAAAGTQAMGLAARADIAAAAAVAAAWAFADSAMGGPAGLAAAPGVSAAAFAAVMADQALVPSFAVGTPYVPHDMMANIHQGEMIIPQTFAEGLRAGTMSIGGSSTTNNGGMTFNHSPTFSGGAAQMAQQAARGHDDFRSMVIGMFRNGQLKLPGR